jgi:hypothetical protein
MSKVVNEKVYSRSPDDCIVKPSSPSQLAPREEQVGVFSIFFGHRLQKLQEKMIYSEAN